MNLEEVVFSVRSVGLFVGLFAVLHKNYLTDLNTTV